MVQPGAEEIQMRVPHNSYVMVADGRKMLFFRNEGDADLPNLQVVRVEEKENPANRDQMSDAPGRTFSSNGSGRSAYENTDFHELEESRFATETADMLKRRAMAGEYEKLFIIAPPRTLGELRKHYHKEVANRLVAEIPKDLTGHPVAEIERIISATE
jgi:protein required for attachment to host cells